MEQHLFYFIDIKFPSSNFKCTNDAEEVHNIQTNVDCGEVSVIKFVVMHNEFSEIESLCCTRNLSG